jgi:acyl-CoA reductase-like NAD-dependent aldehyde dehydrogenase
MLLRSRTSEQLARRPAIDWRGYPIYTELGLFIDGRWQAAEGRDGEDVFDPATGKSLAQLPHATTADLDAAIAAAVKGFAVWRNTSPYERAKRLHTAADLVRQRADHIARILVQEQGKVIAEAKLEVNYAADILDWFAEEGRRAYGRRARSHAGDSATGCVYRKLDSAILVVKAAENGL